MPVDLDPVTLLVAAAMALYAAAAGALAARTRRAGWLLFAGGFAAAGAGWALRWIRVEHVPLQSLYEVFLAMGGLILPISLFCRRALGVRAEWADPLIGVIVLVPVAFGLFSPHPQRLPPALQSPLFVPHVAVYLAAYVVLGKASVQAGWTVLARLRGRPEAVADSAAATYRMVAFGFPLLTLGLVLGAWWARLAWDDFWGWDPKELWSLVSWLVFLAYLHVRGTWGRRYPTVGAGLVLAGLVCILVTLNWSSVAALLDVLGGLHAYG